ncbi:ketopantoate reductase family protein [Gulosibacter sp. ACHW.36C]|uniref:2-dehydropantoate 2-reductase n=1 Tax=Gulosibacter sediminis TaxID=1729695 RepID=A0ABY4N0W7_9MICO|nr:ketopantoate reductase family protein [Gulosibacter sediminis]UQN15942.1 ketopantoate reductase family protein [Gulosibacter sediminis]
MRVSVIGVGAVGGTLAALLARAGHEVHAVARGSTLAAVREHGIRLRGVHGTFSAPVSASGRVAKDSDVVLLAVRTYQTAAAVEQQTTAIGTTPLVVAQNGVRGPEEVARLLGRVEGVYGLVSTFPATNLGDAEIHMTGPGKLTVAAMDPGGYADARELAAAFSTALPAAASDNLDGLLWMKLLLNQVNALPAITGLSVQWVSAHPLLAPILAVSLEELLAVADARRIRLSRVAGMHPHFANLVRDGFALDVVRGKLGRMFGTTPNPASTLQSIRRGQPTEIDALNGEVVRSAAEIGLAAPLNERLTRLVHDVSATGRFLPPRELARRVTA